MKSKVKLSVKIWFWVFVSLAAILGTLYLLVRAQEESIARLEDRIDLLKAECIPLRFQILSRDGDTLRVKLKLYDSEDREIETLERDLAGNSLFIDFISLPIGGRYLAFPHRIFSEKIPAAQGISLFALYDDEGFPSVYDARNLDQGLRKGLSAIFQKLKAGELPASSFGNAVHDVQEFASFEMDIVYKVVTRAKGGIEIMEDNP